MGGIDALFSPPTHFIGVLHQADTVRHAVESYGSVDFLVNNTGINPTYGPMIELDLAVAHKVVDVNVLAALAWTRRSTGPG